MPLQDLVNLALDQRRRADYERAKADALLAATIGEAERLRAAGVSVRELDSDQRIGTLRLDGANLPAAPVIEKTDELASWLAERSPELVTASVGVPVERLEEVLELLDMAGLRDGVEAKVELRDLGKTLAWLGERCKVQADPQIPRSWNVLHVDDEGHTTPVPGTTARPPTPTWKVLVDRNLKADGAAVAQSEAEEMVRQVRDADAAAHAAAVDADRADARDELAELEDEPDELEHTGALERFAAQVEHGLDVVRHEPGDGAALERFDRLVERVVSASMPKPLLVARARELGLPSTGTRAELAARINSPREHAAAVAAVDPTDDEPHRFEG